jgi:hypothetical protein
MIEDDTKDLQQQGKIPCEVCALRRCLDRHDQVSELSIATVTALQEKMVHMKAMMSVMNEKFALSTPTDRSITKILSLVPPNTTFSTPPPLSNPSHLSPIAEVSTPVLTPPSTTQPPNFGTLMSNKFPDPTFPQTTYLPPPIYTTTDAIVNTSMPLSQLS